MNLELYQELDSCIYYCQKLHQSMEHDMTDLSRCLEGEIFTAYEKNTREVMEKLQELKQRMLVLQSEQLI